MYEIYETKERITADNDKEAAKNRTALKEKNVFLINLMGSPGAGKTTTLVRTINALKDEYRIGVMEADVDSAVDAETIHQLGVKVIQLHTGGLCHMDADMTQRGLDKMGVDELDVVFLENIGNLVCPAEFDTGAVKNLVILSVPEGHDKPLKYPLMFQKADAVLINKMDALEVFDFDVELCKAYVARRNPSAPVFPVSAETGEGFDAAAEWLAREVRGWCGGKGEDAAWKV